MTIAQKKKSATSRQKRFQKDTKNRMYKKDTSVSCKEYKHLRRSYREECESWT